jgi:hypothetical protein
MQATTTSGRQLGPNLAQLINERRGDRSYERLSRDCGGDPGSKRLQQMATGKPLSAFPSPETIQGLALGLGMSAADVLHACARSLGLSVTPEDPSELKIQGAGALPPDSQEALLLIAREMLKLHRGSRHQRGGATRRATDPADYSLAAYQIGEHGNGE